MGCVSTRLPCPPHAEVLPDSSWKTGAFGFTISQKPCSTDHICNTWEASADVLTLLRCFQITCCSRLSRSIWRFPEMAAPPNGWFVMDNPIKKDDLGVLLFQETSISPPSKLTVPVIPPPISFIHQMGTLSFTRSRTCAPVWRPAASRSFSQCTSWVCKKGWRLGAQNTLRTLASETTWMKEQTEQELVSLEAVKPSTFQGWNSLSLGLSQKVAGF